MDRCRISSLASPPGFAIDWRASMRNTFLTVSALSLVTLGAAACVSKSEYTKAVESAEVR
jgi:hypothetical protein